MVNRLGSVSLLNSTMIDVAEIQRKMGELQEQISSGVKANDFKGLNGQVEQFTQLESRIRKSTQYMESNDVAISRAQTADEAMKQMVDIATNMQTLIIAQRNGSTGDDLNFELRMKSLLEGMADQLNTSFDGRYIFGGTNTLNEPVPNILIQRPVSSGVPDINYYAGSGQNTTLRADEQIEYEFPVRADNEAFQKIFAAAHQALDAYRTGGKEEMKAALDLIKDGQVDLNSSRSELNTTLINLQDTNERLSSLTLYWKGVTEKVGKTDIVAATTEISNYQAVLQATFQVYARLSQLKLSDYL